MKARLLGAVQVALITACIVVQSADGPMAVAISVFDAGENEKAEKLFRGQLGAEPAQASYYLGRIQFRRDDLEGAVDWLEKAVEKDPSASDFHLWLGRAYLAQLQTASMFSKLGLSKKVRASYVEAIELNPDNLSARESLGWYYFEAPGIGGGSTDKAMEQVREIKSRDALRGHRMLASHYIDSESFDLAEKESSAALALAPDDPDTLFLIGRLSQARGDSSQAIADFEKVLALDPDNMAALYAVGRAAAISGKNSDRGIECLERYLENEPDDNTPAPTYAHWRMGLIYEHKRDKSKARQAYERALELDPDNDDARKALKKLS